MTKGKHEYFDRRVETLNEGQAKALEGIKAWLTGSGAKTATLVGYAGTGKSYLEAIIAKWAHEAKGMRVMAIAPTHKACEVIRRNEVANYGDVATVCRALGGTVQRTEDGSMKTVYGAQSALIGWVDLLIVDEASMVTRLEFDMLLAKAGKRTKILFVGDPAQLPPVEDAPNLSPVFDRIDLSFALTQVMRAKSGECDAALLGEVVRNNIDAGRWTTAQDLKLPYLAGVAWFRHGDDIPGAPTHLTTPGQLMVLAKQAGENVRIIARRNVNVAGYNGECTEFFNGVDQPAPGDRMTFAKAFGVEFKNNSEWDVEECSDRIHCPDTGIDFYNVKLHGSQVDVRVPVNISEWIQRKDHALGQIRLARETENKGLARSWRSHLDALDEFADLRQIYSITAHKSQGSTYDVAIVDLRDIESERVVESYNRMLYVAMTRPSKWLMFVH